MKVRKLCGFLSLASLFFMQAFIQDAAPADPEKVEQLIRQLGAPKIAVRDEVTEELIRMGSPVAEIMKKVARESRDPEVRHRARRILQELLKVPILIEELRDDDIPRNAMRSMDELQTIGTKAIPELEQALTSEDAQQCQMAAELLRRLEGDSPSDALLKATVDGLRHDDLPNARRSMEYLFRHIERSERYLAGGLFSDDGQQQFLCAYILGVSVKTAYVRPLTRILTDHLRDNAIRYDACLAAQALYRLGEEGIPYLRNVMETADAQQRVVLDLITLYLTDPKEAERQAQSGMAAGRITQLVRNPNLISRTLDLASWKPYDPVPLD